MIEGGCNCGTVRYKLSGTPLVTAQCHCRNCQRQSGSAFSVNLVVRQRDVETTGELTTWIDRDTHSGNPVYRRFCGTCGSPIFSDLAQSNGTTIIKLGTLDDPAAFLPAVSVWTTTKLPWVDLPDGQKAFDRNA